MNKIPQTTIYAKQTGVSITPHERRSEGRATEGRIALRFFRLASGSSSIRFIAEPAEAFALHDKMQKVLRDGGQESLNHRFEGNDGEVKTRLIVALRNWQERTGDPFLDQANVDAFVEEQLANRDLLYRTKKSFRWSYLQTFPKWRAETRSRSRPLP